MKIRIVGDGTFRGTRVETLEGERIEMVQAVEFKLDKDNQIAQAKLTFLRPEVDIIVEDKGVRLAEEPDAQT